jgi:ABC-type polysaccharide/polyol phosphate export permease
VIVPSIICCLNNIIIFKYVRSSTNRVQPTATVVVNNQHQHINRRDIQLLRHMVAMFCIFVGGWSPIYIYAIIVSPVDFTSTTVSILVLLAELCLSSDIINLFLYNHELRRYFHDKICKRT